jgi:hypothetical protein
MGAGYGGVQMRVCVATILALTLAGFRLAAAAEAPPLAPGKPAGLAKAQINNHQLFIYITLGGTVVTVAASLLLLKSSTSAATATSAPAAATATTTTS